MENQFLEAALFYATLGWRVLPLCPGQKTPITKNGCKDATTNQHQIRTWWEKWPSANIGLACGEGSGVYVVDVDVQGDMSGWRSLEEFPELPATVRQDTPRSGAHFLYRSTVPPANRNSFRPGIDIRGAGYYIVLAPSIHPNGGRYAWSPGCAPRETPLADYPEFMRPATRIPWSNNVQQNTVQTIQPSESVRQDTVQRASLYLAQCDPAIQGQGGHDKLLYAASRLVQGFLLTDSQTFDLLAKEYNPRCVPPWEFSSPKDHKDFCRKISEARKLTPQHPPGWLLEDAAYAPVDVSMIDVGKLLQKQSATSTIQQPVVTFSPDQEYQFLIRPAGLLGEICSWINATAIKEQPFLSLACSLAFLGGLFGRKVRDELGSRTNLYCMGVAPSSAGKAHAMNQIRRLASASGCTSLLGGDDIASDSAIEDRVSREPSTLFMWDEIGHLLAHIKSGLSQHHAQVVSLLMKLYSASGNIYLGKEYAEQQRQRVIVQPCCCIYGTSTMERFASGISPIELQDGWLSRCLVFHAPFDTPKKRNRRESPVPQSLSERVNAWATRIIPPDGKLTISTFVNPSGGSQAPTQILVPTSPDAERIFIDFDNEAIEYGKHHAMLACLWMKAEENARRIALIVATGENFDSPIITASVADYACRLMRYILMDFGMTVAPEIVSGSNESDKRKIMKCIEKSGKEGCLQCDLSRATQWLRKKSRNELLDDMMEAGEVARKSVLRGKVTSMCWWTAEHYAKLFDK